MKLQVAFDMVDLDKAIQLATEIQHQIDIIEVGSLLIYRYGTTAIERFRTTFPEKTILADMKIVDRGKEAVKIGAQAGADWITVLAGTSRNVIHSACSTAHDLGKKIMLDLIDASSLGQSALEAQNLGADALLFHRPADENAVISLEQWDIVKGNTKLPVFIATTLARDSVQTIFELKPGGIVVSKNLEKDISTEDIEFLRSLVHRDH